MKLINKRSNDLSKLEKLLIAVLFATLLITCFLKLGGLSTFEAIRNLNLEQDQIRAELEQLDAVIADDPQIRASYLETAPERQRYEKLLPSTEKQPTTIGNLEQLIYGCPGRLLNMRVNEKIDYGDYSAQTITVKIGELTTFPNDLILHLEHFPQLLVIEQIDWQAGETGEGLINLSFSLYFLN